MIFFRFYNMSYEKMEQLKSFLTDSVYGHVKLLRIDLPLVLLNGQIGLHFKYVI